MNEQLQPLGVKPTWLWLRYYVSKDILTNRLNEINLATVKYINVNKEIPTEWTTERNIITKALK